MHERVQNNEVGDLFLQRMYSRSFGTLDSEKTAEAYLTIFRVIFLSVWFFSYASIWFIKEQKKNNTASLD